MTSTKESLPINLITSYLSNGLLLVSSTASVHPPTGGCKSSTGFEPQLPWLLLVDHDHNHPGADICHSYTSSSDLPKLCLLSSRPICPSTDQPPFPRATQTQLIIFFTKTMFSFPHPQFLINKRLHLPIVTQALHLDVLLHVSLTFPKSS